MPPGDRLGRDPTHRRVKSGVRAPQLLGALSCRRPSRPERAGKGRRPRRRPVWTAAQHHPQAPDPRDHDHPRGPRVPVVQRVLSTTPRRPPGFRCPDPRRGGWAHNKDSIPLSTTATGGGGFSRSALRSMLDVSGSKSSRREAVETPFMSHSSAKPPVALGGVRSSSPSRRQTGIRSRRDRLDPWRYGQGSEARLSHLGAVALRIDQ